MTKALRHDGIMPSIPGADYVQMARRESGKKSEFARSPHQGIAAHLSIGCSISCACPPIRPADAAARDRFVLGRASTSRRSPGARACCPQRSAERLELASRRQERVASHIPDATRAFSGTRIRAGSRLLLRVRATDLSLRLACRSVGHWDQQECGLAHRMRGRMAILDCAEWPRPAPPTPASTALRRKRRTAVEERRG